MLVGREGELAELLGAAAAARAEGGRGWLALIGGEPGIGKTRLAREVANRLRSDGVAVAWAVCRREGGAPPYWPWHQLLRELGRTTTLDPTYGADLEAARFLLFEAIGEALRDAAPVLLVLDDLQWADEPSLRLLDSLPAHVGEAPVLVLGTYRDTEPDNAGLARIAANRRLVLRGLSPVDLALAVAETTGESLDGVDAVRLHQRTGGNPFYASEVVRLVRAEGGGSGTGARQVPGGVLVVLEHRLDRLPQGVVDALRAAAILGAGSTSVDTALLAAVAGEAPAALSDRLLPAVEARLVLDDDGRYRFPHGLIAETVIASTPRSQRLELHRRAAATLELRLADGVGEPAGPAYHLAAVARLSGEPGDLAAAVAAATAAANVAMARLAYEDAIDWLRTGLDMQEAAPAIGAASRRADLLCALGEAELAAGHPAASRRAFLEAVDLARRAGNPELLAAAALGATGGSGGFEVDLTDPDRVAILSEALESLPASDSALRSLVSSRLSVALTFTGEHRRRAATAAAAVAIARRVGDESALAAALAARCDVLAGPDHVAERRLAADEMIRCAQRARDRTGELLGRRLRLVALAEAGSWVGVDAEIEAYDRVVTPLRQPRLAWYVSLWRGMRAAMLGDAAADARYAADLRGQVASSGSGNAELLALTQDLVRAVNGGTTSGIWARLDRFAVLAPGFQATHGTVALLRALDGDTLEASRHLTAFLTSPRPGPRDSEWLPEMVQAAMVASLIEDRAAAATMYESLAPYAGLFAIEGIGAGTWGCVDGHLGRLARLCGRTVVADQHFATAVELDGAAGSALGERTRGWAAAGSTPVPVRRPVERGTLGRDGDVWTATFADRTVRVRDSKGVGDIAALLARPGRDIAAVELWGGVPAVAGDGYELADRTAIAAYRRRLAELEDELAEARAGNDPVRAEHAAAERDALLDELAAVTGLGSRPRRAGSASERARKAVTNRVRAAIAHLEQVHPELGRHLRVTVRTGTFCRYQSDRPIRWEIRDR